MLEQAPTPPALRLPPAIQTAWWLTRPLSLMARCRARYGDAFSLSFLGFKRPMILISDPEAIRALYTERAHGLPPGRTISLQPVLGDRSLLLLEGEAHIARRRIMLPPFHGERMRAYEPLMREIASAEIARWPIGRPFAVHPRMQALTLEVILRAVFGLDERQTDNRREAQRAANLRELLRQLLAVSASAGLQLRVLLARTRPRRDPLAPVLAIRRQIDQLIFAEIADRRARSELDQRADILSLLMLARDEQGEPLPDSELRDQLLTLLLAGHETTATALAWTIDLLLHSPPALTRLRGELRSAAERPGDEQAQSSAERYLRAVVSEGLRLRPVVPLAGRRLAADLDAGSLHLPAGSDVSPAIWLVHMREDLYPEATAFRPERFLASAPSTYGWIPFGGGVRRCLGASFAEMEMRAVLATIFAALELAPASAKPESPQRRNVTLAPRNGTRVIVRSRPIGAGGSARTAPVAVERS